MHKSNLVMRQDIFVLEYDWARRLYQFTLYTKHDTSQNHASKAQIVPDPDWRKV